MKSGGKGLEPSLARPLTASWVASRKIRLHFPGHVAKFGGLPFIVFRMRSTFVCPVVRPLFWRCMVASTRAGGSRVCRLVFFWQSTGHAVQHALHQSAASTILSGRW